MRTLALFVVSFLSACGGPDPAAGFYGTWRFSSGTYEGIHCFTKDKENTQLTGKEIDIWKPDPPQRELGPQFWASGFTRCDTEWPGIWLFSGPAATTDQKCIYSGVSFRPGAPHYYFKATLTLAGRTLSLSGTEDIKWQTSDGATVEECIFTYKDAQLSYVGPSTVGQN